MVNDEEEKVCKTYARPRIKPLAYLCPMMKRKKLNKFGTRLSYLSRWSIMKRKKVYKNDARLGVNTPAYLSND